jgi:hypothetical protein
MVTNIDWLLWASCRAAMTAAVLLSWAAKASY